jgi:hypothetical protein
VSEVPVRTPTDLLRLGALTLEEDRAASVEALLTEQEHTYRRVLERSGPEPLIAALLERDRHLAQMGRQLADGRTAGRLLREFVRAVLARADLNAGSEVERILGELNAEQADARQLRLHGSTTGPLEDRLAQAEAREGETVSGEKT